MHWSWQPRWVNIFGLPLHCFFPSSSPLPPPGCELYAFCGALFGICSMMTLMVIAVDRYVVITRPLASLGVMSRRKALSIVAAAWVYSMGWSLPPFFGWSEYGLETVVIDQCDYSQGFSLLSAVLVLPSGSYDLCQRVKFLLKVVALYQIDLTSPFWHVNDI